MPFYHIPLDTISKYIFPTLDFKDKQVALFLCLTNSVKEGYTKLPFRTYVCYLQLFLNYPLDCYETWLDCSLGCEYVH